MSIPREGSRDIDKGILISKYPDWCKTPDKPIPYTIYAKQCDDANTAPTVRQTGKRSHTKNSIITTCKGDDAGIGRGVRSGTKGDVCQPKTWSETVRFEGKNVVRHNDEWFMNNKNTTGKMAYVEDTEIYDPTTPFLLTGYNSNETSIPESTGVKIDALINDGLPSQQQTMTDFGGSGIIGKVGEQSAQALPNYNPEIPSTPSHQNPPPANDNNKGQRYWKPSQKIPSGKKAIGAAAAFEAGLEVGSTIAESYMPKKEVELRELIANQRKQMSPAQNSAYNEYDVPWFYSSDHRTEWVLNRTLSIKTGEIVDYRILPQEEFEEIIEMPWPQPQQIKKNIQNLKEEHLEGTQEPVPDPGKEVAPYPITEDNNRTTSKCKNLIICFQLGTIENKKSTERSVADLNQIKEFNRQLALQNKYLNLMTPVQAYNNINAYLAAPSAMRAISKPFQEATRKDYKETLKTKYKNAINKNEIIEQEMAKVAALHNPDMRAGGLPTSVSDPSIPLNDRIGDSSVNSSLGGQWGHRAARLKQHLWHQIKNRCPAIQVQLLYCSSQTGRGNAGKPLTQQ